MSDCSGQEKNFIKNEANQDLSSDSDDSEGQPSSSFESSEMHRDIDLDESDQWCAYSVDKADPLCFKFDDLIRRGLIPKNGILYKYLTDVIEIYYDRCHEYDREVVEFFNTIRHLGGRRTVNFIRGPMNIGQGKKGSMQDKFSCKMNLGGPSESVCNKEQAGYTVRSGVIKPLNLAHYALATKRDQNVPFLASPIVNVIPCAFSNDGNAIKPSIEFDARLKKCVGLNIDVDIDFVKDSEVTPEFLKEHIVTEVLISSVTTLDNGVSMPCVTAFLPKGGKTGEAMTASLLSTIKTLQICENCVKKTAPREHILSYTNTCENLCQACLTNMGVCEECEK